MLLVGLLAACRGASPSAQSVSQQQLAAMVDSLMPKVAKAAGLEFKSTPKSAVRTKDQIRTFLMAKMGTEMPQARLDGITAVYRLLGLMPDTLDLRKLMVDLYTEQIAGFYDADSTTLYAVTGGDKATLTLVLAHELVHALQHQYVALDSIMHARDDDDRQSAAQAILEGQATLASMVVVLPGVDMINDDAFWTTFRENLKTQQLLPGVFSHAPLVIREGLIFPYVEGGEFLRWFRKNQPGGQPFGAKMPVSSEQILHPDRYLRGDMPIRIRFAGDTVGTMYEDTFGEEGIDVLRASLLGQQDVRTDPAIGWGGDRFRAYTTPAGPALVWVTVWDEARYGGRFKTEVADPLAKTVRKGYRITVEPLQVSGKPGVRIVIAPDAWDRWKSLPVAEIQ